MLVRQDWTCFSRVPLRRVLVEYPRPFRCGVSDDHVVLAGQGSAVEDAVAFLTGLPAILREVPGVKVDVARRANDAFNRRDIDGLFAELATPDLEWWPAVAGAFEAGCYQGREGVERFVAAISEVWEELRWVAEEYRDLGDRVLVLGRQVARGKGSGAQVDAPLAGILEFRGDRIRRVRGYVDRAEGLRAAGLSE